MKIGKKHRFRVDGPYLLFLSKLDLFKFLVSEDASEIEHLQFDIKYIKDIVTKDSEKEEELFGLKSELKNKEDMIQAEVLEKNSVKSSLREALSQLDQINQLLSVKTKN